MRLPSLLRALLQRTPSPDSMLAKVALECGGEISASQEEVLATSSFLGGDNAFPASSSDDDDEEEEVFATPPDATQVTMCTLPFTPTPSKTPAPPSDDDVPLSNRRRKPRICTRKVRGARISTPSPSPEEEQQQQQQAGKQKQQPEKQQPPHADPLVRAVLMIPTRTTTTTTATGSGKQDPVKDFLALARQKGIF